MIIGTRTNGTEFHLSERDKARHLYVVGQTGVGKSVLLENLIAEDIAEGEAVALIDPHGSLSRDVVRSIPDKRRGDLIYVEPARLDRSPGLNFTTDIPPDRRHVAADNFVSAFRHVWPDSWGPTLHDVLYNGLRLVMDANKTLLELRRALLDQDFRQKLITPGTHPSVRFFWEQEFPIHQQRQQGGATASVQNKLGQLLNVPAICNIVSQQKNSVDFRSVIDNRKILIVNLSDLGEGAGHVFGALLISSLWAAARSQSDIQDEEKRIPLHLYIDEFQNFTTGSIASILSEARKFRLSLTLAHQYWGQVSDEVKSAVFGNVGTLVSFRIGAEDAPLISRNFERAERQLLDLPDHHAYVRPIAPAETVRIGTCPPRKPLRRSADGLIANALVTATPREAIERRIRDFYAA